MARVNASITPEERDGSKTLLTAGAIIAALYFGQEIFVPIALAILLSFVLAPGVRKLHAIGLGRILPVAIATLVAFTIIFGLAGIMALQLRQLAADLPNYESTVAKKVVALQGLTSGGPLEHLKEMAGKLSRTIDKGTPPEAAPSRQDPKTASPPTAAAPLPVQIEKSASSPMETLNTYLTPLLHPLATAGIVVIFVVFILLQREDLRNRLIRLFGASDLQRTTAAIDDGAKRLSRYLLTQSLLNASTGLLVGLAAWIIGVPNPILWGILFACTRFVPYIGPIIGGVLPSLFAAAVDPGWSLSLWMAGTVLVLELIAGQVLEPLLYGHNTGLSPVAVVVSATFWTVLWGPVGLLLSTPLTVCLVVIGRHVDQLEFLEVLLGDRPPLSAPETFYQRMLANDPVEVADQARTCLNSMSLSEYYDRVVLPGLLLAQNDVSAERLSVERQIEMRDATNEVLDDLADQEDDAARAKHPGWRTLLHPKEQTRAEQADRFLPEVPAAWHQKGAVICVGARGPLDDCGALMLAQVLQNRGIGARMESYARLSKAEIDELDVRSTRLICLSALDGSSSAYVRFAIRRVARHAPHVKILIGSWWMQNDQADEATREDKGEGIDAPFATTIVDAARYCLAAASALSDTEVSELTTDDPDVAAAS